MDAEPPRCLVLYKIVQKTNVPHSIRQNFLAKEKNGRYIGLRQTPEEAIECALKATGEETVGKQSHALLEVFFSPYGVAYFSTRYEESNQFQPILYKMWNDWDNPDEGAWRFWRDLPLWLTDIYGNFLVKSCWWELD
jgi:hypothetical protein